MTQLVEGRHSGVSSGATDKIRVAIADAHAVVREGLLRVVEASTDLTVTLVASTADELLDGLSTTPVDVCVLDLSMPDVHGIELLVRVRHRVPAVPVLVFTLHAEDALGPVCINAGASGFLTKGAPPSELQRAIRALARGHMHLTPELTSMMIRRDHTDQMPHTTLSPREWEIFIRLASGMRNQEISHELHLDQRTVSTYRRRVLTKMHANNEADLVRYALVHELLDSSDRVLVPARADLARLLNDLVGRPLASLRAVLASEDGADLDALGHTLDRLDEVLAGVERLRTDLDTGAFGRDQVPVP